MNIEENKRTFIDLYNTYIKRKGADRLLAWLEKSDFFTAPASTKYHGDFPGGLCWHSINVFKALLTMLDNENLDFEHNDKTLETVAIISLLHDLCKAGYYESYEKNVKGEDGVWTKQTAYKVNDKLPFGHGEKSVFMIQTYMQLTVEEAICIRWHMGGYDDSVKGGSYAISDAYTKFPLALHLHTADMRATYLLDGRE